MAVRSSGPLSFSEIAAEFNNAPQPFKLSEYYKGGIRVPSEVTAAIPSSGSIDFSDFYGAQNQIDPTIPVGGFMHNFSTTRTYPGNGSNITQWDSTFSNTQLWKPSTWRWTSTVACTASYVSLEYDTVLFRNGTQIAIGATPCCSSSFFRYNSGTRTHTFDFTLTGGQSIRVFGWGSGRQSGGETPEAIMTCTVQRLT